MTILGLAAQVPNGDEAPVVLRRWVLRMLVPSLTIVIVAFAGFGWHLQLGVNANAQDVVTMRKDLSDMQTIIKGYEQLRVERERQITALQTKMDFFAAGQIEMNAKLDRLLSRGRE